LRPFLLCKPPSASVQNLFDKEFYGGTGDHFGFGGVRVTPNPRMWRLELIYRTR
jgi:spermidine synthase